MSLDLRSETGKALLRLTKEQFSYWAQQLKETTKTDIGSTQAMHYWHLMATLALDGGDKFRVVKKRVEEALPNSTPATGRRYLGDCQSLGLTETVSVEGTIYAQLTDRGELAITNTLSRWIVEFSKIRRDHSGPSTRAGADAGENDG